MSCYIGCLTAGTAAEEDQADGDGRRKVQQPADEQGEHGKNGVLTHKAKEDRNGVCSAFFEVFHAQTESHCEHENADALFELDVGHPVEGGGIREGNVDGNESPDWEHHGAYFCYFFECGG